MKNKDIIIPRYLMNIMSQYLYEKILLKEKLLLKDKFLLKDKQLLKEKLIKGLEFKYEK